MPAARQLTPETMLVLFSAPEWVYSHDVEYVYRQDSEHRRLDEAIEETFPASDPPANTVATGIRLGASPPHRSSA